MIIQKAEQLTQLLDRRFEDSKANRSFKLSTDMHMDILMAFHDEKWFNPENLKKYSLEEVLGYLEATHRYYIAEALSKIDYAIKELSKSKEDLREVQFFLNRFFKHFQEDLVNHMADEEQSLFPYVRKLVKAEELGMGELKDENPRLLTEFVQEHDNHAENVLEELVLYMDRKMKEHPDCFSLTILRNRLDFFRRDLIVHSLMEEEVLVPMARELERRLLLA